MDLLEVLNKKIEKLLNDYGILEFENRKLKTEIENLKNKNDELDRNNQDMILKIDSTLTLNEANNHE